MPRTIYFSVGCRKSKKVGNHCNRRMRVYPTVILRIMEPRWKTGIITRNLICWIKLNFMNEKGIHFWRMFIETIIYRFWCSLPFYLVWERRFDASFLALHPWVRRFTSRLVKLLEKSSTIASLINLWRTSKREVVMWEMLVIMCLWRLHCGFSLIFMRG